MPQVDGDLTYKVTDENGREMHVTSSGESFQWGNLGNEPITAEWVASLNTFQDFAVTLSLELHRDDDSAAWIQVGKFGDLVVSIETWSEGHETTVPLPHIKTRNQFRSLIGLLKPQ